MGFSTMPHFRARAANCCQRHIYIDTTPQPQPSSLFGAGRRPAPADSCALHVLLTAAFSWGEIKRLGRCGHVLASGDGDNA